jgi:hypothetical protein
MDPAPMHMHGTVLSTGCMKRKEEIYNTGAQECWILKCIALASFWSNTYRAASPLVSVRADEGPIFLDRLACLKYCFDTSISLEGPGVSWPVGRLTMSFVLDTRLLCCALYQRSACNSQRGDPVRVSKSAG